VRSSDSGCEAMTPSGMHGILGVYLPRSPLLSAAETAKLLGYPTTGALAKARQTGRLPIAMFQVPGRRGWFASTEVVRAWLESVLQPPPPPP
jgi:hypothetical protein